MTYEDSLPVLVNYRNQLVKYLHTGCDETAKLYEALDVAIFALKKTIERDMSRKALK